MAIKSKVKSQNYFFDVTMIFPIILQSSSDSSLSSRIPFEALSSGVSVANNALLQLL